MLIKFLSKKKISKKIVLFKECYRKDNHIYTNRSPQLTKPVSVLLPKKLKYKSDISMAGLRTFDAFRMSSFCINIYIYMQENIVQLV